MMTQPMHTPGPWEHNGNAVHKRESPHYATCVALCEGEDRHANAAIIADAPKMLELIRIFHNSTIPLEVQVAHEEAAELLERHGG